jgi:hypothetical protein
MRTAQTNGKLRRDYAPPERACRNRETTLRATLAPFRREGLLPDYPLGSDFTAVEQRLVQALDWLKRATVTRSGTMRTVMAASLTSTDADPEAMRRMQLDAPRNWRERLTAKLVALALSRAASV